VHVSFVIACVLLMTLSLVMITEKSMKFFLASTFCDKISTLHDKLFAFHDIVLCHYGDLLVFDECLV